MTTGKDERTLMEWVAGSKGSWLYDYVSYARQITDAPLAFHVGAGLVALAGAVGAKLSWRGGGGRENWPNLYILLLAPSGIYRKSTSVDLACGLLERACPGVVMDREFSPERFILNLAEHPTSVLKEAEFSSLLERMKSNYMNGLKQRLTELYDCVGEYGRNINGGEAGKPGGQRIVIRRPALSIISASTTEWLVQSITEMDLRSGFLPRFLLVASTTREPEPPNGYWAERDALRENALVGRLGEIGHRMPAHLVVGGVRGHLVDWDDHARQRFEVGQSHDDLSGVYSRLAHSVAKLCALLTIAEMPAGGEYHVTESVAERACGLMDWILESTERTFEEHLVFEKFEQMAQRYLGYLGENGMDKSTLLRKLRCAASDMARITNTLKERGQIMETEEVTGGRHRNIITKIPDLVTVAGRGNGHSEYPV